MVCSARHPFVGCVRGVSSSHDDFYTNNALRKRRRFERTTETHFRERRVFTPLFVSFSFLFSRTVRYMCVRCVDSFCRLSREEGFLSPHYLKFSNDFRAYEDYYESNHPRALVGTRREKRHAGEGRAKGTREEEHHHREGHRREKEERCRRGCSCLNRCCNTRSNPCKSVLRIS